MTRTLKILWPHKHFIYTSPHKISNSLKQKGNCSFPSFFFFVSLSKKDLLISHDCLWLFISTQILQKYRKNWFASKESTRWNSCQGQQFKIFPDKYRLKSVQEFKICLLEKWTALCIDSQWVSWWYLQKHQMVQQFRSVPLVTPVTSCARLF